MKLVSGGGGGDGGLDSSGSVYGPMVGSCEYIDQPSGSINGG
jgi:hypothetical protein